MVISFSSTRLQKLCNSEKEMRAKLGVRMADKLAQRLSELRAVDILEDLKRLPSARYHELSQDRAGQLAVDLIHPNRLVFQQRIIIRCQ
jgi:plasmid maintenance system killer protein